MQKGIIPKWNFLAIFLPWLNLEAFMVKYLNKLFLITQFLALRPSLDQLTTFLSMQHCPSGETSSVYFAKITKNDSLLVEAAHGFQDNQFVRIGKEFPIDVNRPSGKSILENQIIFDEVNPEHYLKYPALQRESDGELIYPWSSKVSIPINSMYFAQFSRYCSLLEADKPFYQNIQSLLQIYFSHLGKVSLEIGDLNGKPLTARQEEILKLMKKGMTNEEIASLIGFSASLVKQESMLIFSKLGLSGRRDLEIS